MVAASSQLLGGAGKDPACAAPGACRGAPPQIRVAITAGRLAPAGYIRPRDRGGPPGGRYGRLGGGVDCLINQPLVDLEEVLFMYEL